MFGRHQPILKGCETKRAGWIKASAHWLFGLFKDSIWIVLRQLISRRCDHNSEDFQTVQRISVECETWRGFWLLRWLCGKNKCRVLPSFVTLARPSKGGIKEFPNQDGRNEQACGADQQQAFYEWKPTEEKVWVWIFSSTVNVFLGNSE